MEINTKAIATMFFFRRLALSGSGLRWFSPGVVAPYAFLLGLLLSGCGGGREADQAPPAPEVEGAREGPPVVEGRVTREEAEKIGLEAVGVGRVTWSGPEDDRGAAWEVEVTRPDGSEVDVLVAADGSVIKVVGKFGQAPPLRGGGEVPAAGVVSRERAEQAALAAVGSGRVTWVGREDERGAAWEVEITRPDGTEIDVLIAPDGSVVR